MILVYFYRFCIRQKRKEKSLLHFYEITEFVSEIVFATEQRFNFFGFLFFFSNFS